MAPATGTSDHDSVLRSLSFTRPRSELANVNHNALWIPRCYTVFEVDRIEPPQTSAQTEDTARRLDGCDPAGPLGRSQEILLPAFDKAWQLVHLKFLGATKSAG